MLAVSGATNLYLRLKAESNKSSQSQGSTALLTQPLSPKACVCGGGRKEGRDCAQRWGPARRFGKAAGDSYSGTDTEQSASMQ